MRKEIAAVAGVDDEIGFGDRPAVRGAFGADFVIFEVLRLFHRAIFLRRSLQDRSTRRPERMRDRVAATMSRKLSLRIAVRKFGPFEDAIRRQFDDFARRNRVDATMAFDSLDLNDLHPTVFDRGAMHDGTYDITFMVTDWLAAAVEDGLLADLSPLMKSDPLAGLSGGLEQIADDHAANPRRIVRPAVSRWAGVPDLSHRSDLFAAEDVG